MGRACLLIGSLALCLAGLRDAHAAARRPDIAFFLVTESICGPSRSAIMTDKYGHIHRRDGLEALRPRSSHVFGTSARGGLSNGALGKYHLGQYPPGFDDYNISRGQGRGRPEAQHTMAELKRQLEGLRRELKDVLP
ncbi:MAG: hypothetical protein N2689_17885 [Verrucomicrobiae bacterium]|nr:hypothetical protein [Verrucomicrobiae bacterium]